MQHRVPASAVGGRSRRPLIDQVNGDRSTPARRRTRNKADKHLRQTNLDITAVAADNQAVGACERHLESAAEARPVDYAAMRHARKSISSSSYCHHACHLQRHHTGILSVVVIVSVAYNHHE
jgi:hypothetical protein